MMTSMLNLETGVVPQVESREPGEHDSAPQALSATTEYEIVLGRAQIASWLFVGVIAVAICSSLAYLGGEKIAVKKTAAISRPAATLAPVPQPVSASAELPQASILAPPQAAVASMARNPKPAPLFAEPEIGKVYIQIAAVERGMATLLVEGLRSHGLDSFVAPGPNDKLFRVLIGPLPDPETFRQAMVTVNAMDLASFARKYQK
jgi:cell division septation protein DedD